MPMIANGKTKYEEKFNIDNKKAKGPIDIVPIKIKPTSKTRLSIINIYKGHHAILMMTFI